MPATKKREKNAERIKVLEEFGFAIATPQACTIADALIAARKKADVAEWIKRQVDRGNNIEVGRELAELEDETSGLCFFVWKYPQTGREAGCGTTIGADTTALAEGASRDWKFNVSIDPPAVSR
jgi:hypothetical protein